MSNEHNQTLWWRDSGMVAQVVKQPNGDPGRKDPLHKTQGQGEHRVAVITNDMPDNIKNPVYCHVGSGFQGPFGKSDSYKYLDGTRILVHSLGPNRDFEESRVISQHTGPEIGGGMGAKGDPTTLPTVKQKG